MKEATEILIKLIRTGELFLADEKTLTLVNAEPTYLPIFFEGYNDKGLPLLRGQGRDTAPSRPQTLKATGDPKNHLHALFWADPNAIHDTPRRPTYTPIGHFREHTSDGACSVFEPIEVLGRPARELQLTEAIGTRKLEGVLTAELEGVPTEKARYRSALAALLMTDQGGVIGITRLGEDLLFESLEGAIADQMIYPEELDIARIQPNPKRDGAPWFSWAKSKASLFPFEVRPFLKEPTRAFTIPRDVCQRLVDVAGMGPDFVDPEKGPAFIFLTPP